MRLLDVMGFRDYKLEDIYYGDIMYWSTKSESVDLSEKGKLFKMVLLEQAAVFVKTESGYVHIDQGIPGLIPIVPGGCYQLASEEKLKKSGFVVTNLQKYRACHPSTQMPDPVDARTLRRVRRAKQEV